MLKSSNPDSNFALLSPREMQWVARLRLQPDQTYRGAQKGERISKQKGTSIEFADYRNYIDGDDLRHLDWNVLARLDVPVMRTYQEEEELPVVIVVDGSASMQFGSPPKLDYAQKCAAALGVVALGSGDSVRVRWSPTVASVNQPALQGTSAFGKLIRNLCLPTQQAPIEPISRSLDALLRGRFRPGVVMILSDGLDPKLPETIRQLGGKGHEVWMLQVLSEAELNPDLEGDLRLIDSESQDSCEITVNRESVRQYQQNLESHGEALKAACLFSRGKYEFVLSSVPIEELFLKRLKKSRWFK